MLKFHHIYQINEIPDENCLENQKSCQSSVPDTISKYSKHLLEKISILKIGAVEVTLRILLCPASKHKSLQSRMPIFLIIKACDFAILDILKAFIKKGIVGRLYNFISVDNIDIPWNKINEISVITREENLIKSSISNDSNYQVPPYYYLIQLFEPNESNDFMDLDKTFDKVKNEIVIIDIAVKPIEIKPLCLSHTNYLDSLNDINNSWSINNDELLEIDYFDNNKSLYSQNNDIVLTPLKIKDPVAEEIHSKQYRFQETLYDNHLAFNIRVLSETAPVNNLITSCVANSGFKNGHYQSFSLVNHTKEFKSALLYSKHINFHDTIFSKTIPKDKKKSVYADLAPLSQCGSIKELSGIFRLPVASFTSPCCIRSNTDPLPVSNKTDSLSLGVDMEIKDLLIKLILILICKHFSVFGMPGSGKTTMIHNLMINLWEYRIPFIVIETAKTEYRNLKIFKQHSEKKMRDLAKHLQIYSIGNEELSPFRINPLKIPKNTSKDNHIASVLTLFQSSIPMSGPLPALITEALERVYEDYPDNQHPPILKDLVHTVQSVLKEKSYSLETRQDILTAIEVRLGSLIRGSIGKTFQCRQNIPAINELTNVPSIVEMDALKSNEQKCFLTLNILTQIKENIKSSFPLCVRIDVASTELKKTNLIGR